MLNNCLLIKDTPPLKKNKAAGTESEFKLAVLEFLNLTGNYEVFHMKQFMEYISSRDVTFTQVIEIYTLQERNDVPFIGRGGSLDWNAGQRLPSG